MMNGAAAGGPWFPRAPRKVHLTPAGDRTSIRSDEEQLVSRISVSESYRDDDDEMIHSGRRRGAEDDLERGPEMGTERERSI